MKLLYLLFPGLLLSVTGYSQPISIAATTPKELANSLIINCKTDGEKVYALFRWVTDNIDYRLKPVNNKNVVPDTSTILKPLDEIVAEQVLKNKVAVCDGYTRLFKTLCTYAGINCVIITGYARSGAEKAGSRFRSNHTWNAVYLDSSWHLLDVTWASGYVSFSGDYFVRHYEPGYFLTAPEDFIQDHYPEEVKWSLLSSMPTFREFKYAPFKTQSFVRSKVKSYFPTFGTIEAEVGELIQVRVEVEDKKKELFLSDSLELMQSSPTATNSTNHKMKTLSYLATHKTNTWLDVMCEDQVLLRYKLIVKEKSQ